jgi:hypothetical protein
LVIVNSIFAGGLALRIGTALHQPVGQPRFDILHRQIFKLADEHAQMAAHRTEHPQREFRLAFEQRENAVLLHKQNLRGFQRAGVGGITGRRRERHLGKGSPVRKTWMICSLPAAVTRCTFTAPRCTT